MGVTAGRGRGTCQTIEKGKPFKREVHPPPVKPFFGVDDEDDEFRQVC